MFRKSLKVKTVQLLQEKYRLHTAKSGKRNKVVPSKSEAQKLKLNNISKQNVMKEMVSEKAEVIALKIIKVYRIG